MRRIIVPGYTCPLCGDSIRLVKIGSVARCRCMGLMLYGHPEKPVVSCASAADIERIDSIMPVDDDYPRPDKDAGGKVVLDPKVGKVYGMPRQSVEFVMPLLAYAREMKWTGKQLVEACQALLDYDKMLGK